MNKIFTITVATVLSFTGVALTASAHDEEEEAARLEQQRIEQQRIQQTVYERGGVRTNIDERQGDEGPGYERRPGADDHQVFQERRGGGGGGLRREVDHLNRMMARVGDQLRTYGGGRRVRAQYEHLRAEASELNNQFQRGDQYYDRRRIRGQIEHMHAELHQIEQNMRVPVAQYYQWR